MNTPAKPASTNMPQMPADAVRLSPLELNSLKFSDKRTRLTPDILARAAARRSAKSK